jgi:hypothetical protein
MIKEEDGEGRGVDSGKYIDRHLRIDSERKENGSRTPHQNKMKSQRILLPGPTREETRYANILALATEE